MKAPRPVRCGSRSWIILGRGYASRNSYYGTTVIPGKEWVRVSQNEGSAPKSRRIEMVRASSRSTTVGECCASIGCSCIKLGDVRILCSRREETFPRWRPNRPPRWEGRFTQWWPRGHQSAVKLRGASQLRSGSACLNSIPGFIRGRLCAGWLRTLLIPGGSMVELARRRADPADRVRQKEILVRQIG